MISYCRTTEIPQDFLGDYGEKFLDFSKNFSYLFVIVMHSWLRVIYWYTYRAAKMLYTIYQGKMRRRINARLQRRRARRNVINLLRNQF